MIILNRSKETVRSRFISKFEAALNQKLMIVSNFLIWLHGSFAVKQLAERNKHEKANEVQNPRMPKAPIKLAFFVKELSYGGR